MAASPGNAPTSSRNCVNLRIRRLSLARLAFLIDTGVALLSGVATDMAGAAARG